METSLSIRTENTNFELSMIREQLRHEKLLMLKKTNKKRRNQRKADVPLTEQIAFEFFDNYLKEKARID
jgi:hypothetical protein